MNDRHRMVKISPAFWRCVFSYYYVDPARPTRSVEYRDSEDVWKYIGGGKRLPSASHIIITLQTTHSSSILLIIF